MPDLGDRVGPARPRRWIDPVASLLRGSTATPGQHRSAADNPHDAFSQVSVMITAKRAGQPLGEIRRPKIYDV